jgi:hypothetical protein
MSFLTTRDGALLLLAPLLLAGVAAAMPAAGQEWEEPTVELTGHAEQGACPHCQGAVEAPSGGCQTCCHGRRIDWSKYPATIDPMPRPGNFPLPPSGNGYYSACDHLQGVCRPEAPKSGYQAFAVNAWPFFDADWRYVDKLPANERTCVEEFKRLHLNDCLLLSLGGEFWTRYANEEGSRLGPVDNDYALAHVRQYADLWYSDHLRLYCEYIWADSFGEELAPLPPDVDRGDILDLFVDVELGQLGGKSVYLRGGRQELVYGSQRLVSPLPWANKRNSFDGVKIFRQGEKWDFDAFWTQFVPPHASEFDTADSSQNFAGTWLTYKPRKGEVNDFYYLLFDNNNSLAPLGILRAPFQTHTFGSRWSGDRNGMLWDFEGAMQLGEQGSRDLVAGMATAGLGRHVKQAPLRPTFWLYYDYASGDDDLNSGDAHTFYQQFPFGHYYLGWTDTVGRQNIHDVNAHMYLYPTAWTTVWLQYHHFWLAESRDALYNSAGVPLRRDPTGAAGRNVGDEIDLVLNFHLTRYSDILVSYNHLFGGSFLENTAGASGARDVESLFLIFQQRW